MAYEESASEKKARKAKEAKNKKEAEARSAVHDAEVIDKMRSSVGMPTAAQAAMPATPPAPVDPMGSVAGPAPTSMKKGGSAHSRADGIATKGHTKGKYL